MTLLLPVLAQAKPCDLKDNERFKVTGGTVVDTKSGLTWMRCALGSSWQGDNCVGDAHGYSWREARMQLEIHNSAQKLEGDNRWRMPSLKELQSLVELQCYDPAIHRSAFPQTPPTGFWSSTPYDGYDRGAWLVYFMHGESYLGNINQNWAVRGVRGN